MVANTDLPVNINSTNATHSLGQVGKDATITRLKLNSIMKYSEIKNLPWQ